MSTPTDPVFSILQGWGTRRVRAFEIARNTPPTLVPLIRAAFDHAIASCASPSDFQRVLELLIAASSPEHGRRDAAARFDSPIPEGDAAKGQGAQDTVRCSAQALAKAEFAVAFNGDPGTVPAALFEDDAPTWRDAFLAWAQERGYDDNAWFRLLLALGALRVFDPVAAVAARNTDTTSSAVSETGSGSGLSAEVSAAIRARILGTES